MRCCTTTWQFTIIARYFTGKRERRCASHKRPKARSQSSGNDVLLPGRLPQRVDLLEKANGIQCLKGVICYVRAIPRDFSHS